MILLVLLCLGGGLVASLVVSRPPSPSGGGLVFAAGDVVAGATLGEWSARQWQWTLSQPIGANPGQDPTGATCGAGQDGPVFFLPRNFPPCHIPAGTLIFVPIVGSECSTVEPPPFNGTNDADLRACAAADVDRYTNIIVRIDGEAVPDVESFRVASPRFALTLPEHNVLGVAPGTAEAVADGYQLLLAPLPPGAHEIMVHVELADGTVLPDKIAEVTVLPPGRT
jgi:hypothetical protein